MASLLHKITATRLLKADMAHRVYGHENKCAHLHGHEYRFEVSAKGDLDDKGRVIDYSVIKGTIGGWIDNNWDHGTMLWAGDPLCKWFSCPHVPSETGPASPLYGQKFFCLPDNPTAENIASYLLTVSNELMKKHEITISKIVCWETQNCFAVAEL